MLPPVILALLSITLLLVVAPAIQQRSWLALIGASWRVILGMLVPLVAFIATCADEPDWKGASPGGWIGCFDAAKLVLLPLVVWALACVYALEVWRDEQRAKDWLVLGCSQGAVVSGYFCLRVLSSVSAWPGFFRGHGLGEVLWVLAILLMPFVVCAYFAYRTRQLWRESEMTRLKFWVSQLWGLPFWIGALFNARRIYSNLPDEPPQGCFVVTAAARGHAQLVGPFVPHARHARHGRVRHVNRQLLTFWAFEQRWQSAAPRTHRAFRRLYNNVGPHLARRLTNPWLADAAYLALKPCEWLAARLLRRPSPNSDK